jgi:hypothetical protein
MKRILVGPACQYGLVANYGQDDLLAAAAYLASLKP